MDDNNLVIETRDLTKRYNERVTAVDNLALRVRRGEVYGFLGPNGSGKTTTLRMLLGLTRPTSGSAVVLGARPRAPEGLARIGALVETPAFYPFLSGYDNLLMLARHSGVPRRRITTVLEEVGLAVTLVPFVLVVYGVGAVASVLVATRESATLDWPSAELLARGMLADWLILLVWTALGVLLAVLTRGTALAIGIGILYTLVIEGLLTALADSVSLLERLGDAFVRVNAYSLVEPLGATAEATRDNGPGSFNGPYVGGAQALLVLAVYALVFLGASAYLLQRRDVV